ncbi:MAG TPA: hypothetical protein VHH32_06450 [Gemmatimonadales bacterium]|nr:hypothetical protein [Gemmatimonadales bacterium]
MLNPKFAALYPELSAGLWLSAWQATVRRAERVWREAGAEAVIFDRLLPDEHFDFRGGRPRDPDWHFIPERLSDPTLAELGNAER